MISTISEFVTMTQSVASGGGCAPARDWLIYVSLASVKADDVVQSPKMMHVIDRSLGGGMGRVTLLHQNLRQCPGRTSGGCGDSFSSSRGDPPSCLVCHFLESDGGGSIKLPTC
jgi:hypothetical protein